MPDKKVKKIHGSTCSPSPSLIQLRSILFQYDYLSKYVFLQTRKAVEQKISDICSTMKKYEEKEDPNGINLVSDEESLVVNNTGLIYLLFDLLYWLHIHIKGVVNIKKISVWLSFLLP